MVHDTDSRVHRTLGATAAGFALLLAVTGCSSSGSSDESEAVSSTPEFPAPSSTQDSGGSDSSEAATKTVTETATETAEATKSASAQEKLVLDTVGNKEDKFAVVSTGKPAKGKDSGTGKLVIADQGCFHAIIDHGAPTLLVFPEGTKINNEGQPSVTVDGDTFHVGERINFTGKDIELDPDNISQIRPCRAEGAQEGVFQVASMK